MQNEQGFQLGDYRDQARQLPGTPYSGAQGRPVANPARAQNDTMLFGGTETDGAYTASWTLPDGSTISVTVDRVGGVPATNADLATQAVANIAGDDDWSNLATAEVDGGTPEQVNITWIHADIQYPAAGTLAPAPGTLAQATTQTAGGVRLPAARFLVNLANEQDPEIPAQQLPLTTSVAADIIGLSVRPHGQLQNTRSGDPADVESYEVTDMFESGFEGGYEMVNNGSVATTAHGAVFAVVNPAGGDEPGEARSDADGGNTVALTLRQAYWVDVVQPGESGQVFVRL